MTKIGKYVLKKVCSLLETNCTPKESYLYYKNNIVTYINYSPRMMLYTAVTSLAVMVLSPFWSPLTIAELSL